MSPNVYSSLIRLVDWGRSGLTVNNRRDEVWSISMTMGDQIPVISVKTLVSCGCSKFQLDTLGDHLCTCTSHSGAKKDHDWSVDQIVELFRTTHKVKTQHVTKSRGRHCGDVDLTVYHMNTLHYPNDIDKSLNEVDTDKIRSEFV
jgi:hypothetical protein